MGTEWRQNAKGYARLKENVTNGKADNHEGIDFYHPVEKPDKSKPLWGENQWPAVPGFKEKYDVWIEKMKTLGLLIMEACDSFPSFSCSTTLRIPPEWQPDWGCDRGNGTNCAHK